MRIKMIFSAKLPVRLAIICLISIFLNSQFVQAQKRSSKHVKSKQNISALFSEGAVVLKIPLEIDNNIILMKVSINDSKPLRFIFDTGASLSIISSKRAAELGLKARGEAHGNATGGKIKGTYAKGVSLGVQGAKISDQLLGVIPFPEVPDFEFDGVIGRNFIERFVIEIDYQNKLLNLYDPRAFRYSGNGEVIPLILAAKKTPLVNTEILFEGRPVPINARLEVDTGFDGTFNVNSPLVKKQKLTESMSKTTQISNRGAGGEEKLIMGLAKTVRLGKFVFYNSPIGLSQDTIGASASEETDGIIGGEIFRRFKVFLDYSRKRMILEPNKSFNDPYEMDNGE